MAIKFPKGTDMTELQTYSPDLIDTMSRELGIPASKIEITGYTTDPQGFPTVEYKINDPGAFEKLVSPSFITDFEAYMQTYHTELHQLYRPSGQTTMDITFPEGTSMAELQTMEPQLIQTMATELGIPASQITISGFELDAQGRPVVKYGIEGDVFAQLSSPNFMTGYSQIMQASYPTLYSLYKPEGSTTMDIQFPAGTDVAALEASRTELIETMALSLGVPASSINLVFKTDPATGNQVASYTIGGDVYGKLTDPNFMTNYGVFMQQFPGLYEMYRPGQSTGGSGTGNVEMSIMFPAGTSITQLQQYESVLLDAMSKSSGAPVSDMSIAFEMVDGIATVVYDMPGIYSENVQAPDFKNNYGLWLQNLNADAYKLYKPPPTSNMVIPFPGATPAELVEYGPKLDELFSGTIAAPPNAVNVNFEVQGGQTVAVFDIEGDFSQHLNDPNWQTNFKNTLQVKSQPLYNTYRGWPIVDPCENRAYLESGYSCNDLVNTFKMDVTGCGCGI